MVVFGGDENVGVEGGDFLAPGVRVRLGVLVHRGWYGLIQERQLVILDVDDFKLRVLATFQDVVHPLCNGPGFSSRSRATDDDSNTQHFFSPSDVAQVYTTSTSR